MTWVVSTPPSATVWIIAPSTRSGRTCRATEWVSADRLEVAGTPIHVDLPQLFSQLETASDS